MSAENREKYARRIGGTAKVPCEPLGSLMDRTGIGRATLLSLDVGGAEAKVLSTVDPGRFDVVLVESDGSNPEGEERPPALDVGRARAGEGLFLGDE